MKDTFLVHGILIDRSKRPSINHRIIGTRKHFVVRQEMILCSE
jgi:hypothetical protein